MIYFIRAKNHIKIGFTRSTVETRLRHIQLGNPYKLEVLGQITGGARMERRLHRKFKKYRAQAEWFRAAPELVKFVRACLRG